MPLVIVGTPLFAHILTFLLIVPHCPENYRIKSESKSTKYFVPTMGLYSCNLVEKLLSVWKIDVNTAWPSRAIGGHLFFLKNHFFSLRYGAP